MMTILLVVMGCVEPETAFQAEADRLEHGILETPCGEGADYPSLTLPSPFAVYSAERCHDESGRCWALNTTSVHRDGDTLSVTTCGEPGHTFRVYWIAPIPS